jgi:hypothetical protein
LPASLLSGRASFSATVQMAQQSLGPPQLEFHVAQGKVRAGGASVELAPVELAFYLWLARRAVMAQPPVPCPPDGAPSLDYAAEFLAAYRDIVGTLGDDDRVTQGLRQGMDKKLGDTLGSGAATYLIQAFGRRPRTAYGLNLTSGQILVDSQPIGSAP